MEDLDPIVADYRARKAEERRARNVNALVFLAAVAVLFGWLALTAYVTCS